MANHDWVDNQIAALAPDREWTPNASRTLSRLRARAVRARRWMWTSLVATSACMMLFLFPASRACAEQPGPCVLRAFGVSQAPVVLEISPEFRPVFERDILPRLTEPWILSGKVKVIYRQDAIRSLTIIRDGKREVITGAAPSWTTLEKRLTAAQ